MPLLADISGIQPTTRLYSPSDRLVSPTTVVGIEIEVEEARRRIELNQELWRLVSDGSLRNDGIELVSRPLFGEDVVVALEQAQMEVERIGAVITSRCGLHVHIDVSGFNTDQLISLTCAVALAERTIYKYVGEDRRDNIYCLPISDTANLLPFYNAIKYGHGRDDIVRAIKRTQKYSGFNILPILTQGSVEFRHHKGTYNAEEILRWINIIMRIREAGMNFTALELVGMGYNQIITTLFGPRADELVGRGGREDLKAGWLVAKDILNFNKLEEVWMKVQDVYIRDSRINLREAT